MKIETFNIVNKKVDKNFFRFRFTFFSFCGIINETSGFLALFPRFWGVF
jgi:hypothetical protein